MGVSGEIWDEVVVKDIHNLGNPYMKQAPGRQGVAFGE
jgi:hypothetical protein